MLVAGVGSLLLDSDPRLGGLVIGGRLTVFAPRPACAIAAGLAAVMIATSNAYGYHRDELYFLACARHLAWGYPDQPLFVPLVARLMSDLAPTSLVVLRLPSALAAMAVVVLTGLIARELGGGRGAQLLAATAIAISALLDASGHTLNTNIFDLAVWALVAGWSCASCARAASGSGSSWASSSGLACSTATSSPP